MTRVLIIEDAPDAAELASAVMRSAGFETSSAATGRAGLTAAAALRPDVVLLDLGLPDMDGTDVCRELRGFSDAFVVMLTARDDEIDKVLGLKLGADDYVTKPYSPREILARVEAMLRRRGDHGARTTGQRHIGSLLVEPAAHRCTVDGSEVSLTRIEFAILDALSEHPDRVLSRQALCERVWGDDWVHDDHVVDVHIANLRRKIDRPGTHRIRTVRGVGYGMDQPGSEPHAGGTAEPLGAAAVR